MVKGTLYSLTHLLNWIYSTFNSCNYCINSLFKNIIFLNILLLHSEKSVDVLANQTDFVLGFLIEFLINILSSFRENFYYLTHAIIVVRMFTIRFQDHQICLVVLNNILPSTNLTYEIKYEASSQVAETALNLIVYQHSN